MSSKSSPFDCRLGTNYCPNDDEILHIQTLLIEPKLRLKRLDDKIAELQRVIDELTEERDGVATSVIAHEALLSPIRRLPIDLLQEIFCACLPLKRKHGMSSLEAPVLLGRVCSSWRVLSLSTPALWAGIHIFLPTLLDRQWLPQSSIFKMEKKIDKMLEAALSWLSRSGEYTLSISLEVDAGYWAPSPEDRFLFPFLERIRQLAPRLGHLRFSLPERAIKVLAPLSSSDVPSLQTFWFNNIGGPPVENFNWETFGILQGVRLSGLSLWGCNFNPQVPRLGWAQLTTMELVNMLWAPTWTSDTILDTISKFPQLRTCSLLLGEGALTAEKYTAEMPKLNALALYFSSQTRNLDILDWISSPNIRQLTLVGYEPYSDEQNFQPLLRFLDGSRLETLRIVKQPFSRLLFVQCLRSLPPTLQHLEIEEPDITDLWDRFSQTLSSLDNEVLFEMTQPSVRPKLETLILKNCRLISDRAVLEFIRRRMAVEPKPTLKHVRIEFQRPIEVDIMPSLQPLLNEGGLDVSITHTLPEPRSSPTRFGLSDELE